MKSTPRMAIEERVLEIKEGGALKRVRRAKLQRDLHFEDKKGTEMDGIRQEYIRTMIILFSSSIH